MINKLLCKFRYYTYQLSTYHQQDTIIVLALHITKSGVS